MDTKEYNSRVASFRTKYPTGGTRMPIADRHEAVVLWNTGVQLGISSRESARELELHDGSIRRWENEFKGTAGVTTKKRKAKRKKASKTSPARSCAVVPTTVTASTELSLTLPNGANVSGLTLDQLKELIRG